MTTHQTKISACWTATLIVIASFGCFPSPASADLYNIGVTADTYIEGGGSGNNNYGTDDKFFVGNEDAPNGSLDKARKTYLRFDVSSLSTVDSASLAGIRCPLHDGDDPPVWDQ